jgi:drug/metabolite transporter (DMT)-like permease
MAEQINVRSSGRRVSIFQKIPWTLTIILYMVVVHFTSLDMSGVTGYIFLGLSVLVLFLEFFKSGDIGTFAFLVDILGAVFSLVLATVLMSYLIFKLGQTPTFFHWFGCAIILGDAILGPFNAFRTALRNVGLGVSA